MRAAARHAGHRLPLHQAGRAAPGQRRLPAARCACAAAPARRVGRRSSRRCAIGASASRTALPDARCARHDHPHARADPARRQGRADRRPADLLRALRLDEQFAKLFKVRADFSAEMDWTAENERAHRRVHPQPLRRVRAAPLRHGRGGRSDRVQRPPGRGPGQADHPLRARHRPDPGGGLLGRARRARAWSRGRMCGRALDEQRGPLEPVRRADARDDRGRHDHGGHAGRGGRAGQRPGRARAGRLRVRPAQPDHRDDLSRAGRGSSTSSARPG